MSLRTAPYNDAMRLGTGFNSYTQQICVNDAVIKDNKSTASEKDMRPKMPGPHNDNRAYIDSSKVKENDINFIVQVKFVNQQLVAEDVTQFNAIPSLSAKAQNRFIEVYGDSIISGFLEGGEFNALLSVKVMDKAKISDIKGHLSLNLSKAGFGIEGEAQRSVTKEELLRNTESSISVSWTGGGDIQSDIKSVAFGNEDATNATSAKTNDPKMAQQMSEAASKLVPKPKQAEEEIKKMKEEYAKIISEGNPNLPDLTKNDFPHIPDSVYDANLLGLERARLHCRLQIVDAVADDPRVAVDPYKVGQFLNPLIFKQLLPSPAQDAKRLNN
ncbi:hypothetical protein ATETN484_0010001200 [Aspergillus terreus]|nr:hypothetical protein ATETN484_0010001200 [Aspergillus terreus]